VADQWYVARNGQQTGPYSTEQLRRMAAGGELGAADLIWKQGLEAWVPLSKVKGLLPAGGGAVLPPLDLTTAGRTGGEQGRPGPRTGDAGDWNPYQASTAAGSRPGPSQAMVYADFFPRVGAAILDGIFIGVIGMMLQFGLAILFGVASGGDEALIGVGSLLGSLLSFVLSIVYFVGYETSAKQGTWGKQIVGIKVTDIDGRPITTGRAVGRFFAKIISNLTCGIGYLLPLFTEKKQTLHDLICGCLALKK
jgi:uncharacterized RDD family membrane protein YckC